MKYLIIVDMQNDFINGSLPAAGGKKIVGPMIDYIKDFKGGVIFTRDTHDNTYFNTLEGKNLPIEHCRKNTEGWKIIDELEPYVDKIINKNTFASVKLARIMQAIKPEEIQICGVCTSICVASNALMIRGYCPNTPIVVLENLCADVNDVKHNAGIETMEACQITRRVV